MERVVYRSARKTLSQKPVDIFFEKRPKDPSKPWTPEPLTATPQRLSRLVDVIFDAKPDVGILVASVPPMKSFTAKEDPLGANFHESSRWLGEQIREVVRQKAAEGEKVHFVDVFSVLTVADLRDGIHLKPAGYQKIGDAFAAALCNVLGR